MCQQKGLISTERQTTSVVVVPLCDKGCNDQGGKGESQEQPDTADLCLIIYLGEQWRHYPQLARNDLLASLNFTQKGKPFLFCFLFLLAFVMICVVLSAPLQEIDAFSPSILQPIPLPPFPWENLNY